MSCERHALTAAPREHATPQILLASTGDAAEEDRAERRSATVAGSGTSLICPRTSPPPWSAVCTLKYRFPASRLANSAPRVVPLPSALSQTPVMRPSTGLTTRSSRSFRNAALASIWPKTMPPLVPAGAVDMRPRGIVGRRAGRLQAVEIETEQLNVVREGVHGVVQDERADAAGSFVGKTPFSSRRIRLVGTPASPRAPRDPAAWSPR